MFVPSPSSNRHARVRAALAVALGCVLAVACDGRDAAEADEAYGDTESDGAAFAGQCVPSQINVAGGQAPLELHCDHDETTQDGMPICLPRQGTYASAMCGGDTSDEFLLDVPFSPAILEFQLDYTPGGPPWRLHGDIEGSNGMSFDNLLAPGGRVIWFGRVERLWMSVSAEGADPNARYELLVDVRPDPRAKEACEDEDEGEPCAFKALGHHYFGSCRALDDLVFCAEH